MQIGSISLVRRCLAAALGLALVVLAEAAGAQSTRITFLLANDIYLMSDQMMPDGKRRGGFARLAAVVKAERAKGAHVIFAHGGDTLSPSLMSSIDRGEHIITLTNLIPPDIFAPGNHEFDFGKANFCGAWQKPSSRSMPPTCGARTVRSCRTSGTARS
jgi:5'-nucleotidase / UDP-sugar diphosphatase